ncbi:hypothetical protein D3C74_40680 [compost metagenome]
MLSQILSSSSREVKRKNYSGSYGTIWCEMEQFILILNRQYKLDLLVSIGVSSSMTALLVRSIAIQKKATPSGPKPSGTAPEFPLIRSFDILAVFSILCSLLYRLN